MQMIFAEERVSLSVEKKRIEGQVFPAPILFVDSNSPE